MTSLSNYREYVVVEKHVVFSKDLYFISRLGHDVLDKIESAKMFKLKRCKKGNDIYTMYVSILNTIKPKRSLCNNIFSSLVYYLDELLFNDVHNIKMFYIEDDEYALEKIYYNQREWIGDDSIPDVEIDSCGGESLTAIDCTTLATYFETYKNVLEQIKDFVLASCDRRLKLRKKILRVIGKIQFKHKTALDVINIIKNADIQKN